MAVGKEVDSDKMKEIPSDGDVIETNDKGDPEEVGGKIMNKVATGTFGG